MGKWVKPATQLMGWGSVALGGIVLLLPKKLGRLLGLDTSKRGGLILALILAVRDLAVGVLILRSKDTAALRRSITVRMLCEVSDTFMTGFGRGLVKQPEGRKLALGIPPLIVIELWVLRNLKD